MHIDERFLDVDVQRGAEQVFNFALLLLEKLVCRFGIGLGGIGHARFEEAGGRQLFRIAGDNDAARAEEDGERFLDAALRRFIEDDDIEERLPRKDLRDGGGAGHPDGAEIEERIAFGRGVAGGEHLAELERALATGDQALLQRGARNWPFLPP